MIYAASDPGKTGGWAVISSDGIPLFTSAFQDWKSIYTLLKRFSDRADFMFALEKVHAMPGQGVSSMFSFGMNFGSWCTLLEVLNISHTLVPPQTWQKVILGSFPKGQSKVRALEFAQRKFPSLDLKKKDSGIVDALCLATYLRQHHTGKL